MGRSIIADEAVDAYIEKLVRTNKWFVGVIIGQLTSQRDYVVHVAKTPDPVENDVSEENGENETGDGVQTSKRTEVERPASLELLDVKWVSTHAKQVSRMLPGGLNVIGLFAIAPPAMLKNSQGKLKQMIFAVHKQLTRHSSLLPVGDITDRILLQLDTSTKRLSCMTIDVADIKSTLRPAEWKIQSGGCKWVQLNSHMTLDIPMAVPTDSRAQTLLKQIQSGMADFSSLINKSIIVIEGSIRELSEPLLGQGDRKNLGGRGNTAGSNNTTVSQDVTIFLPFDSSDAESDPVVTSSQATINMMGTVVVRAYVSARATVSDAVEAIKMDIIRSLISRCELLCEEFDVTEEKQGSEVYDPPVRLFCQLPHCGVDVCDYVFQDEKQEEVRQRVHELLDVDVGELEESEKSAADDDTWSRQSSLSCMSSHQSLVPAQPERRNWLRGYLGIALAFIVALVAVWIAYFLLASGD